MVNTFFTISGIEDEKFPPEHPDVIKFFDRNSAENWINFVDKYLGVTFPGTLISEHNISILDIKV